MWNMRSGIAMKAFNWNLGEERALMATIYINYIPTLDRKIFLHIYMPIYSKLKLFCFSRFIKYNIFVWRKGCNVYLVLLLYCLYHFEKALEEYIAFLEGYHVLLSLIQTQYYRIYDLIFQITLLYGRETWSDDSKMELVTLPPHWWWNKCLQSYAANQTTEMEFAFESFVWEDVGSAHVL